MTARRPHTKLYEKHDRDRLGLAVVRAREAAGFPFRPAFAEAAGVGLTSLYKLETGDTVGPTVYEAVARALPHWAEDTPRLILEGSSPPPTVAAEDAVAEAKEAGVETVSQPNAEEFDNEQDYIDAVYRFLRIGMKMSEESAIRGFHSAAVRYTRQIAEGDQPDASGNEVG